MRGGAQLDGADEAEWFLRTAMCCAALNTNVNELMLLSEFCKKPKLKDCS